MKTVRKTIQWIFLLLLAGTAGGGGYAFYLWNQSDELLKQALLERIHELAPGWEVSISRARPDWWGRIHVYELSLKSSDGFSPLLDVPEAILTVDREHLADPQPPIRHVRWIRPKVHLERDSQGVWNWQKLPPLNLLKNVLPEFHAEGMTIAAVFHDSPTGNESATSFSDVNLQLIPRGAREFLVLAAAKFSHSDGISAEGNWQIDAGTFELKGKTRNLTIDGALSRLAAEFSPEYRAGLSRLDALLDQFAAGAETDAPRISSEPDEPPSGGAESGGAADPLSRMEFSAVGDAEFRLRRWRPGAELEYNVSYHVLRGEMKNPPVPFPLRELRGDLEFKNDQLVVRDVSARTGVTQVKIEQGRVLERGELRPADFDLEITGLALDDRIPRLLPPAMKRVFDDVRPTGEVDVRLHLEYNGHDRWDHDCDLVARNGTVSHKRFPYRIEQVEGTIKQRGDIVDVAMQGRAGTQRVNLAGRVKNPGDAAASVFVVKTAGIQIDERLRAACPPRYLRVIDQLRAQGELDGTVRFERAAGLDKPVVISVDARFRNGTVNCVPFPYPLSGVSGEFRGSGDKWDFENFVGRHGPAEVACHGDFRPNSEGRLELKLDFSLTGAMFDRQLLAALPEDAQNAWREFNPEGGLNVAGRIFWSPAHDGRVRLAWLDAELSDAKLSLKSFPFSITDAAARIHYDGVQANIESFYGRHDDTIFRVEGGLARYESDGEWRLRLDPVYVDDLEATPQFRRALPGQLSNIVDALNPRGKQSISGMLEFRGRCGGGYPVTAAWRTVTVYSGTTINAGVDLRDIHGKAYFSGTWDGEVAVGEGRIEFNSLKVFDVFQLTGIKGPASINGTRLILGAPPGTRKAGARAEAPDPAQHITAQFVEGLVALDAVVDLGTPMRYQVHMSLSDAELKRYAQLYMPGSNKLAGKMNGEIDLKGEGVNPKRLSGTGKLVISPAALYELPVIVQIFNVVQFIPPDKKAFDKALFVFDVKDCVVHFERIDLLGDAITLVGRGTVNFDGNVKMRFASRLGRRQFAIPVIHEVMSVMSKDWVGVEVQGTLKEPKTRIHSFQQIDEALRRLLGVFDARGPQRR
jgi:hypothetical protein